MGTFYERLVGNPPGSGLGSLKQPNTTSSTPSCRCG